MKRRSWLEVDRRRPSWIILLAGPVGSDYSSGTAPIQGPDYWELGVGNPERMFRVEAAEVGAEGTSTREKLFESLLEILDEYRHQNSLLLTAVADTVPAVRRGLIELNSPSATLRGFAHVNVESVLERHFNQTLEAYQLDPASWSGPRRTDDGRDTLVGSQTIERVWNLLTTLLYLVPSRELQGELL